MGNLSAGPNYDTVLCTETVYFRITERELTVTTQPGTKTYDGTALTATGDIAGLVTGETVTFSVTGTRTDAGSSPNSYSLTFDKTAKATNYTIIENLGTLTVDQKELIITTGTDNKTYDGTPLTASGSVTGFVTGEEYRFKVTGTQTNAGSSSNTYLLAYDGTTKASNYTVTENLGTLTVDRKAVTVTADDKSKPYSQTDPELTASVTGTVGSDTVVYSISRTVEKTSAHIS